MSEFGLANERTALSWQRTALSLAVAALGIARLTVDRLGPAVLVAMGVTALVACWIWFESARRYRVRRGTEPGRAAGGRSPAAVTALVLALGLVELAALLLG